MPACTPSPLVISLHASTHTPSPPPTCRHHRLPPRHRPPACLHAATNVRRTRLEGTSASPDTTRRDLGHRHRMPLGGHESSHGIWRAAVPTHLIVSVCGHTSPATNPPSPPVPSRHRLALVSHTRPSPPPPLLVIGELWTPPAQCQVAPPPALEL
jgi:hypothetical protein